jgi:hypothetical protein
MAENGSELVNAKRPEVGHTHAGDGHPGDALLEASHLMRYALGGQDFAHVQGTS